MNIHNRYRTIYFARVSSRYFQTLISNISIFQSGQSLIEHSYKADSDLSPAGWEYAEKLKEFVLERRAKSLEQRGLNPQDRRLVVSTDVSQVTELICPYQDLDVYSPTLASHCVAIPPINLFSKLNTNLFNPVNCWIDSA